MLRFGVILSKALIYGGYFRFPKSWCRQHLIDYPIFSEFRIELTVSVGCCLFDLDVIKPWINISPMDQTKFFQLRTALLWESGECIRAHDKKTVDNPMKPKDIDNWYYHITRVALRSKAPNNSNITWMEYENNTFPIKESPCPRVAHV